MTFADLHIIRDSESDWKPLNEQVLWSDNEGWVSVDSPDVLVLTPSDMRSGFLPPLGGYTMPLDKWLQSLRLTS